MRAWEEGRSAYEQAGAAPLPPPAGPPAHHSPPPASVPVPQTAANSATLEVNYLDVANTMPVLAIWLADHPREMLPLLGETAKCAASLERGWEDML